MPAFAAIGFEPTPPNVNAPLPALIPEEEREEEGFVEDPVVPPYEGLYALRTGAESLVCAS